MAPRSSPSSQAASHPSAPLPVRPTAVLLDLDGTITDSAPVIVQTFRSTLAGLGRPVPDGATLMSFIGPPLSQTFESHVGLTGAENQDAVARYRAHYGEHMLEAGLYDGVLALLQRIHTAGIPMAVATSKNEAYA